MNWRIIGESLNSADQALYEGHGSAIDLFRSILTERLVKDRQMQHFIFRRLALGYTAIGAHKEARRSFNNAFELSRTDTDFAQVFYDRGKSYLDRGLHGEALSDFLAALDSYEQPQDNNAVIRLIQDRIAECEVYTESSDDWDHPVADRPGQSTTEILANWDETSQTLRPTDDNLTP